MRKASPSEFQPALILLQETAPAPLGRAVLWACLTLMAALLGWASIARLDIVAVAPGKLVPKTRLQIVQPPEPGILKEILVREGDTVQAGQVLMRMDTTLPAADAQTLQTELKRRELQLRRIAAELDGQAFARLPGDPEELYQTIAAQYEANRAAYEDARARARAALERAEGELASAAEEERKLAQMLPHSLEQERAFAALAGKGLVGTLEAKDKAQARMEREQELLAQRHRVAALKAQVVESRSRLAQLDSERRAQLLNERVEALSERERLVQEWRKQEHRSALMELKAPEAGIIKDLATHTEGSVVSPGTVLMTLVPRDETLLAEVWVRNEDVGFVHPGQAVRLKLAAFPFQKYGMLAGRVAQVGADATDQVTGAGRDAGDPVKARSLAYRVLVDLASPSLRAGGFAYELRPGMQLAAEILLGERTVLEYLLSPVRQAVHEAAREP